MGSKRSAAYFDLRPLDDDLEVDLAQRMGKDWHAIGVRLGVSEDLENIEADYRWQSRRAWEMLQRWKRRRGEDVTEKELYTVLLRCERKDLADLLLKRDYDAPTFRPRSKVVSQRDHEQLRHKWGQPRYVNSLLRTFPPSRGTQFTSDIRMSRDDTYLDQIRKTTHDSQTPSFGAFLYNENDADIFHAESLNIDFPGYFGKRLSPQQGALKLLGQKDGTYLIRDADDKHSHHKHTLMLVVNGAISNIKIYGYSDGCVYADSLQHLRKRFRNLKEMISWHKANKIKHLSPEGVVDVQLTEPVLN
jgi:hypothetical protein